MSPAPRFKRFDVRPLLAQGVMPLPAIEERLAGLRSDEGLVLQAPFLPSPLIEMLRGQGWESRFERGTGAEWLVYFWRAG